MILLRIFSLVFLIASGFSLLLPYTHRFNLSLHYEIEPIKYGYEALIPYPALLLMIVASAFILFSRSKGTAITAFVLSCIHCIFMLIVRAENHFQGLLASDEYDTKSGIGFFVLAGCSVGFFIVGLMWMIRSFRYVPQQQFNEDLLDDLDSKSVS